MGVVAHDVQFTRGNKARVSESDQDVVAWNIATQDATAPNELSLKHASVQTGLAKGNSSAAESLRASATDCREARNLRTQLRKGTQAMQRRAILLAMNDVMEHLRDCYDGWRLAEQNTNARLLATLMRRDVDRMRQLCELLEEEAELSESPGQLVAA